MRRVESEEGHALTVHKDSMVAVSKLFCFHAPEDPNGALTPLLIFIEHLSSPPELVHNFMLTFPKIRVRDECGALGLAYRIALVGHELISWSP